MPAYEIRESVRATDSNKFYFHRNLTQNTSDKDNNLFKNHPQ